MGEWLRTDVVMLGFASVAEDQTPADWCSKFVVMRYSRCKNQKDVKGTVLQRSKACTESDRKVKNTFFR